MYCSTSIELMGFLLRNNLARTKRCTQVAGRRRFQIKDFPRRLGDRRRYPPEKNLASKMQIANFKHFDGQHCETTATGSLLRHIGIELSEPLLFGLGEGLGFIFWNMKTMDFPFIGGRIKADLLTQNICRNLNLSLNVSETQSATTAWNNVSAPISAGVPVGLKLDCFHLDYFSTKFHFAGHYVAMYGFDEKYAYLVDTLQQGGAVKTSRESLALARSEKGPMSSRNLSYTISNNGNASNLSEVVGIAIRNNAREYLNPPISNISYKGILKTSTKIKTWFETM